ncbi:MAG: hypothetical protein COB08_000760 [Rhodobacteraceae bacterium]|nr:hypothetical protein [Paracoccaceae bacterium]
MRLAWSLAGEFHALRAWAHRRAAIRRYHKSRDLEAATVRLLKALARYRQLKQTSEKFFKRARRA